MLALLKSLLQNLKQKDIKALLANAGHLKGFKYNIDIEENEKDKVYILQIYYIASSKEGFIYDNYLFDMAKKFHGKLLDSGYSTDNKSIRDLSYEFDNEEDGRRFKTAINRKLPNNVEVLECFSLEDYYRGRSAIR